MNSSNNSTEPTKTPLAGEIPEQPPEPVQFIRQNLPVQVQAGINMDKKNFTVLTPAPPAPPKPPVPPKKNMSSTGFLKIGIIFSVVVAALLLGMVLFNVTNLDTAIFKITFNGRVTDQATGNGLDNAQVSINGQLQAKTNKDGNFSIGGLMPGDVQVGIKRDGYNDLNQTVTIDKKFLNYTFSKDFALKSSAVSSLKGKLIPTGTDNYDFSKDKLFVNDKNVPINSDGTFNLDTVDSGDATLKFQSSSFKDLNEKITLAPGANEIPDIQLAQAGDITGELKSWIREDLILNTKFFVENVLQDQVDISQDGTFLIKDLDIGKTYKIRVQADGYNTRDYNVFIKQGPNQIPNFKLVEEGKAYTFVTNNTGTLVLSQCDFDGFNLVQVNNDTSIAANSQYYNINDKKLYYFSGIDTTIRNNANHRISLPYSYDPLTQTETLLTTNYADLNDTLTANFVAKRMFYVNPTKTGSDLTMVDISGNNPVIVDSGVEFTSEEISDNGKAIMYLNKLTDTAKPVARLYKDGLTKPITISTADSLKLFSISEDGNKVVFARKNPDTDLIDLVLFDVPSSTARVLKENYDGNGFEFIKGDNNKIVYFANRGGNSNIYTFDISQSKDERVTALTADFSIQSIYQESNLLFYVTNKGLYVLDLQKPKNFKLVTDQTTLTLD